MEITLDTIRDIKIYQSKSGYRFSVDALLLYSFVNLPVVRRIADLGAGSGIIGLLLAKKYPRAQVTLLELQEGLVRLAEENVKLNRLEERVTAVGCDMRVLHGKGPADQRIAEGQYDVVVANPPFRRPKTGRISPEEEKAIARHEIRMTLPDLVSAARCLLRSKGRLFLIHHPERLTELMGSLTEKRMEMKRMRFVHSDTLSEAKMLLVEAVKDGRAGLTVERPLLLYGEDKQYGDEVRKLCSGSD
jgi:tRNA1Val (adenine37-N6)-methyltransferase